MKTKLLDCPFCGLNFVNICETEYGFGKRPAYAISCRTRDSQRDTLMLKRLEIAQSAIDVLSGELARRAALNAAPVPAEPYKGWQIIVDQQGAMHHVPGYELLKEMNALYYDKAQPPAAQSVDLDELEAALEYYNRWVAIFGGSDNITKYLISLMDAGRSYINQFKKDE